MRYQEIKERAATYRRESASQLRGLQVGLPIPYNPEQARAQRQGEIDAVFGQFQVREALEAVGRDVWKEGTVSAASSVFGETTRARGMSLENHLVLSSSPFTRVGITNMAGREALSLAQDTVSIGVTVSPNEWSPSRWDLIVRSGSLFNTDREIPTLDDALREYPLREALDRSLALYKGSEVETRIPAGIPLAEGKFFEFLDELVKSMKNSNRLPAQVREWSQKRIDQLPEELREQRYVYFNQLLGLTYKARGTSGLKQTLHWLAGYLYI